MEKAPDAFRTISEVAREIDVPQHVLRFWESRFTQIKPLKRGGGRRYYRPDDVDLLRGVRHLLYGEGYTIRGVQRILREQGLSFVQNAWRAGVEVPPPDAMDGAAGEEEAPAAGADTEPSLFALAPAAGKAPANDPSMMQHEPATPLPQRLGISSDERLRLQSALADLTACRDLLNAALATDFAAES